MGAETPIDLAHEPSFTLGRLIVRPSTRELARDDGANEVLEPRVMQVLTALGRAQGAIVSRDDLTRLCWEGRVVGEDAINRVISRLRRSAERIGAGSFKVETITKVGYRLIADGTPAVGAEPSAPEANASGGAVPRRAAVLGGFIGVAAVGALMLPRMVHLMRRSAPPANVRELVEAGLTAVRQTTGDGDLQARGLFRRVTELSPDYPDGWGLLAVVYASESHYHAENEVSTLQARAREAIGRTRTLDPGNAYADFAEVSLRPANQWLPGERGLRACLAKRPDNDLMLQSLGRMLARVGRMREAADVVTRAVAETEASPVAMFDLMIWQEAAGRIDEADRTSDRAMQLFPRNFSVWFGTFYNRLFTGRIDEAIAMVEKQAGRPATIPDSEIEVVGRMARALQTRDPTAVDAAMNEQLSRARLAAGYAENALQFACAFGRVEDAFRVADAYFFNLGFNIPSIRFPQGQGSHTRLADRRTWYLFTPVTAPMRSDPRFESLVTDLGLKNYWAESGTRPDYLPRA